MNNLSRRLVNLVVVASLTTALYAQTTSLSNQDVIALSQSQITLDIIIAKIRSSPTPFDTSPDELRKLKEAGVDDRVVLAMVQHRPGSISSSPETDGEVVPGETQAIVYVYRRKEFQTRNMQPSVYVDDTEVARMDDGKFFIIKLDPGKHNIVVNKGFSGAAPDMKPGRKYYFRVSYKPGMWKARSEMEYVPREQGELEVENMKPLEEKWIKDKARVLVKN